MVRIKDIALEAEVSEGTVDRVIHNRGGVSKKTEDKIKRILKKRNFSLNLVASALATQNKYNIAVLIPDFSDTDEFWKSPYLGILKATEDIKSLGIGVTIFKFKQYNRKSYNNVFHALLKTKPSAVIFVPLFLTETSRFVEQLKHLEISYMFLNVDLDQFENSLYIGQDSYNAGVIAGKLMHLSLAKTTSLLIIQGGRNVSDNNAISKRIEGFKNYYKIHKIKSNTLSLNLEDLNNPKLLRKIINPFLLEHPEIEGVFVPSSKIANIVNSLSDTNLKRLTLIGFDNTPQNINCLKNDTVSFLISQKPFEQGYEAVRMMKDHLLKKKILETKIYLPIDILTKENVSYNERSQMIFENELSGNDL